MNLADARVAQLLIPVSNFDQGEAAQRGSAIYFQVPDIQAVHASLKAQGVKFKAEPHVVHRTAKSQLWLAEFTDPDGNQLALMAETTP